MVANPLLPPQRTPSPDFMQRIQQRRAQVEPYLPLMSPGMLQVYGDEEPRILEVISSQSHLPASPRIDKEYVEQIRRRIPEAAAYAAYYVKAAEEVKTARKKLGDFSIGGAIDKLPPDAQSGTAAQLRKDFAQLQQLQADLDRANHGDDYLTYIAAKKSFDEAHQALGKALSHFFYPEESQLIETHQKELARLEELSINAQEQKVVREPEELKALVQKHLAQIHGIPVDKGEAHLFHGGSWAVLATAIGMTIKEGQYVAMPEMHWDGYNAICERTDAHMLEIPRGKPLEEYLVKKLATDKERDIGEQVREKLGCILLTHPCSITGKRYTDDELKAFIGFTKKYGVPLVVNEIYASPDRKGKPFNSITRIPEFGEIRNMALVSSSLTKTFNHYHIPSSQRMAYFWSANKEWANRVAEHVQKVERPLILADECLLNAILKGTPPEFFVLNENMYDMGRKAIGEVIREENAKAGHELLSWSVEGEPEAGHTVAIHINAKAAAKAGIRDPLDAWEYIYKVAGVNAGPVFFSEDSRTAEGEKPMALRVNYSGDLKDVRKAVQLIAFAVREMERGLSFEEVKAKRGLPRPEFDQQDLLTKLVAEYGTAAHKASQKGAGL